MKSFQDMLSSAVVVISAVLFVLMVAFVVYGIVTQCPESRTSKVYVSCVG